MYINSFVAVILLFLADPKVVFGKGSLGGKLPKLRENISVDLLHLS